MHFGITLSGLQYFGYTNVTCHESVFPGWSAKAREKVPYSMAFLTMVIAIATGVNPGATGWKILD